MAYTRPIAAGALAFRAADLVWPPAPIEKQIILKQTLALALERRGYSSLTPVQEAVSDPALAGVDLLVSAQTGSGKTDRVWPGDRRRNCLGAEERFAPACARLWRWLIAPTRELAMQVKRELGLAVR